MERFCLDCHSPIVGRSDKKFCDDACRSHYNNKRHEVSSQHIRRINAILKKNRRILEDSNPEGKTKIKLEKLQSLGFNFGYFTHIYTTTKGNTYYFCYEYGYLLLPPDDVLLVKREDSA